MEGSVFVKEQFANKVVGISRQLNLPLINKLTCICADCRKIRDSQGVWQESEVDVYDDPGREFTHGYCPECLVQRHLEVDNFIRMAQSY